MNLKEKHYKIYMSNVKLNIQKTTSYNGFQFVIHTVKPLITNRSEEFIKCRLDNFSMSFILYYASFSICENK